MRSCSRRSFGAIAIVREESSYNSRSSLVSRARCRRNGDCSVPQNTRWSISVGRSINNERAWGTPRATGPGSQSRGCRCRPSSTRRCREPGHLAEALQPVPEPEHDQRSGHVGEREAVDLVLGDEHAPHGGIRANSAAGRVTSDEPTSSATDRGAKAHQRRLGSKPNRLSNVAGRAALVDASRR